MFPLILGGMRGAARLTRIQPELKQYQDALTSTSDERAKALLMQEMKALMKRENVSLFAPLKAPIVSMPLFLGTFWGLEAMCELPVWQLKVQGTAWFTDLTAADPTYILPITSALATWCIIHVRFSSPAEPPSSQDASADHPSSPPPPFIVRRGRHAAFGPGQRQQRAHQRHPALHEVRRRRRHPDLWRLHDPGRGPARRRPRPGWLPRRASAVLTPSPLPASA